MKDWSVDSKPWQLIDHTDIIVFVDYCYEFYGPDGVYPDARVTKTLIFRAAWNYLKDIKVKFEGDSIDRENTYRYLAFLINPHGGTK